MLASLLTAIAPVKGVLLAFALGLLIGVERGWSQRNDADGKRVAGVRTFALLGLAGGLAGEIGRTVSATFAALILGAAIMALLIGYVRSSRSGDDISGTSAIVGIVTLGIGLVATAGQEVLACVLAALVTLVLSSRRQLHAWITALNEAEVQAIARFALIALAILPILPDRAFGPFDAWNARHTWMVVVLVSGFSFAGYVAARWLGASKGTVAMAAAGAVISSTAVTTALANRLKKNEGQPDILVAGIAIASAVMFLRVLVLTAALAPFAFPTLAMLVGPAACFGVLSSARLLWRSRADATTTPDAFVVRNPFDIGPALLLAGLVLTLSAIARWLLHEFGEAGLATALTISGMLDVDSAIITMAGMPPGSLDGRIAGLILAAPVMLNTLVKAAVAIGVAGRSAGWRAARPLIVSVLIALVALPFVVWGVR